MRKLLVGSFFCLSVLFLSGQRQVYATPQQDAPSELALTESNDADPVGEFLINEPKSSNHEKEYFKIDATEIREQEEDDENELDSFKKRVERSKYESANHDKAALRFASRREIASAERDFSYLTESERYLMILVFRI